MENTKGLSQVVTTVLLILLSVAAIAIVWGIVNSFVENKLEGASSCLDVLDQIELNNDWTCYNTSSNKTLISINRGDAEMTSVLVSVSLGTSSTVFRILNESSLVENVREYLAEYLNISLPSKEGGKTYVLSGINQIPEQIIISVQSGKKQCGVSDFVESVYPC